MAALKPLVAPFPQGPRALHAWPTAPAGDVRDALVAAVDGRARTLWAFGYTVADSPVLGCLAHDARAHDVDAVGSALEAALSATTDPQVLGVPTVNVVHLATVPPELRAALDDAHVLHRAGRGWPWRRRG